MFHAADLMLLNKIDRVNADQLSSTEEKIREIAPDVPVLRTRFAEFDLTLLDELTHPPVEPVDELGEGRPDPVLSITLQGKGTIAQTDWQRWVDKVQPRAFRVKGFVTLEGQPTQVDGTPEQWQQQLRSDRNIGDNQLVVIGRKLDSQTIRDTFLSMLQNGSNR